MALGLRTLVAVIMTAFAATSAARAQDSAVYVVSYVEVLPAQSDATRGWLKGFSETARKEAGNVRFEVLQRIGQPHHFALLEVWRESSAQQAHAAAADTKALRERIAQVEAAPYDERFHTALATGVTAPAPAGAAGGEIYAVTHVDCVPTRKDDGVALLKALAEPTRKDGGNLRFDVVQQANRPNHFTVMEAWTDQAASLAHAVAPHTRAFRTALHPIGGALYDERFYKAID